MTTVSRPDELTADLPGVRRSLPGGGAVQELRSAPACVTFVLSGSLRTCDRYPVVDAVTGSMLAGARHSRVECDAVSGAEVGALLGLARVRRFVERTGGSFVVDGLSDDLDAAWRTLDG